MKKNKSKVSRGLFLEFAAQEIKKFGGLPSRLEGFDGKESLVKYIAIGGYVTSRHDDERHFISAFRLCELYKVNPDNANCSIICPSYIGASGAASSVETQPQFPDSQIKIPNIFTPNNDGINDYFEPLSLIGISDLQLEVVNRWGNAVYSEHSNNHFKWDGHTNTNEPCSDGVYFYKVIYSDYCNKQEIVMGFIQLIR